MFIISNKDFKEYFNSKVEITKEELEIYLQNFNAIFNATTEKSYIK